MVIILLSIFTFFQTKSNIPELQDFKSVRVIDGDTVKIGTVVHRLYGIDSPELKQQCTLKEGKRWNCGEAAKAFLQNLAQKSKVACKTVSYDRYRRNVSLCYTQSGVNLNALMVRRGFALAYRRYGGDDYNDEEAAARTNKEGLWRGRFMPPWQWRKHCRKKPRGKNCFGLASLSEAIP